MVVPSFIHADAFSVGAHRAPHRPHGLDAELTGRLQQIRFVQWGRRLVLGRCRALLQKGQVRSAAGRYRTLMSPSQREHLVPPVDHHNTSGPSRLRDTWTSRPGQSNGRKHTITHRSACERYNTGPKRGVSVQRGYELRGSNRNWSVFLSFSLMPPV